MKWLKREDINRLNNIIFETSYRPFGVAAYNPNEKVSDFVGRREELEILKSQTHLVWRHKISRAVRLEGPAGVGKSTLFNFLKESIEKERMDIDGIAKYLSKDTDIFSTYIQVPDRFQEFSDIWKPMLEGLVPGFSEETEADIGLLEYIAIQMVYRMFKEDPEGFTQIIWPDRLPTTPLKYIEFKHIINPILDGGSETIRKIQDYYSQNKRILREKMKTEVNGVPYEIKKADTNTILSLFRSLDEDDPDDYLERIKTADKTYLSSNDELVNFFNDLMRFYACSTNKQPLLLLGIDEVAKTDKLDMNSYYTTLGNLFVRLRNSLSYVLFIFISTSDDWAKYDSCIKINSDLHNQIQEFMYRLPLYQLPVSEMLMVFKNRMQRFWDKRPSERPTINPYYPFSEESFEYVYRFHLRDLRKSIQFLDEIWQKTRITKQIPVLSDVFTTIKLVRSMTGKGFDPDDFKKFEWKIFEETFNTSPRFKSNSARSGAIEKGIENVWKCIQKEPGSSITRVENNPTIKTSSGVFRPDIVIEIYGNLGAEYRRRVEFQVKAYKKGSTVPLDKIESSLSLFNEGYTDFIYFILTGDGLDSKAEYEVKKLEDQYPSRLRRPILQHLQERVLYFCALYEDITGKMLGENLEEDLITAKKIINLMMGQSLETFLSEIKNLSFRKALIHEEIPEVEEIPPKPDLEIGEVDEPVFQEQLQEIGTLENFLSTHETRPTQEDKSAVKWLNDFPDLNKFKYELCALCSYLKSRESGRYKHKFTIDTVLKNVIRKDASTSPKKFKELVKVLDNNSYLEKEKSSFKWTKTGLTLYHAIKDDNFQC